MLADVNRALAALVTLLALVLAASAVAQGAPGLLTEQDGKFAVRPATIVYTGDGTGIVGRLGKGANARGGIDWESWTPRLAYGAGTVWLDDCNPNCAAGHYRGYPSRIIADDAAGGRFTRLTLVIELSRSRFATDVRSLERVGSSFEWGIVDQTGFPR